MEICRELPPLMDMVETISEVVGIPFKDTFMNLSMKKDNKRRLVLEDTIKLQFTPHRKYHQIKLFVFVNKFITQGWIF